VLSRFSCGLLPLWKKEDRQTQEWAPDWQTGKPRRQLHTTQQVFTAHMRHQIHMHQQIHLQIHMCTVYQLRRLVVSLTSDTGSASVGSVAVLFARARCQGNWQVPKLVNSTHMRQQSQIHTRQQVQIHLQQSRAVDHRETRHMADPEARAIRSMTEHRSGSTSSCGSRRRKGYMDRHVDGAWRE
jgi:hypothetical protein